MNYSTNLLLLSAISRTIFPVSCFLKSLNRRDLVNETVCMIQKEVAVRIASPPGSKDYGILSVLLQAYYHIEYLFTVPPQVFNPPPKVQSAVIRLRRNNRKQLGLR